jgi:putative ABC transport system substrate-binding protein
MRRREFLAGLISTVAALPLDARGQQSMPVLGYLSTGTMDSDAVAFLGPFRQGLREIGFVEGQNLTIEYRFAEFQNERLSRHSACTCS